MGKGARNKKRKQTKVKNIFSTFSPEELLLKAQEFIDTFDYTEAQKLCQEVIKRDPDNFRGLETSANLCIETGNLDGAKSCLGRLITLAPDNGYTKYLTMGQILEGRDALNCYLKAVELMNIYKNELIKINTEKLNKVGENELNHDKNELNHNKNELNHNKNELNHDKNELNHDKNELNHDKNELNHNKNELSYDINLETNLQVDKNNIEEIKTEPLQFPVNQIKIESTAERQLNVHLQKLSNAHCAIAELYMSNLCDEPEAESESLSNIKKAVEIDSSNPEAHQLMANYSLVQGNTDDAKVHIKKSVSLWLPKYEQATEGDAPVGSFDPVQVCSLSESARTSAAQILIEVSEHDLATDVLDGLIDEDDEVVYTWYLLGWNEYLREDKVEAKKMLSKALEVHKKSPSDDVDTIEHIKELLGEMKDVQITDESNVDDFEQEIETLDMDVS